MKIENSNYGRYIKEREGLDVLEGDNYFIIYKMNESQCFIYDMWVDPECREQGKGTKAISRLEQLMLNLQRSVILADIYLKDPNHKTTLMAAFSWGFNIVEANNNFISIARNIKESLNG